MRASCAPTAPVARQAPANALRSKARRLARTRAPATSPRAQAASWGGDEGNKDEWRSAGKQIVEALTRGSSLARAASVWFVDRRSDSDGASTSAFARSATASTAAFTTPSSIERFYATRNEKKIQVDARRESLARRALAHPESKENEEVRRALESHLHAGGATVLLAPIVDPLIVDLSADAERDARATFDEDTGSFSAFATFLSQKMPKPETNDQTPSVFVEGTACACDPHDPGDCCARGLSEYCVSCPTLVSCDESLDGLGSDGLQVGSSVDHGAGEAHFSRTNPSPLRSTDALESLEILHAACAVATKKGDCAFSKAIKKDAVVKTSNERGRTYYAAVVKTGVGNETKPNEGGALSNNSRENNIDTTTSSSDIQLAGYELFLVYRPNGDQWLAGVVPPPTTVRRARFGPKLTRELFSLARRGEV